MKLLLEIGDGKVNVLRRWRRVASGLRFAGDDPLVGELSNQFKARFRFAVHEHLESGEFAEFAFGDDVVFDTSGDAVDALLLRLNACAGRDQRV
jgi:hypothetical protein